MKHYDIIIIGSGGGTKLRPAADAGKTVAILEKEELGGTCLNKGCIPSKMLIYPSDVVTHIRENAENLHISGIEHPQVNFQKLVEETNHTIRLSSESIAPQYESHPNITLYRGHGKFVEDKIIEINAERISADKIYIATGSRPQIPDIPGLAGTPYMTSKEALRTTQLPKTMIVIGGGYIAVELGHVYGAMGVDIHFLVRSKLLQAEDRDIRTEFEKDFSQRYNVHTGVVPRHVEYREGMFFVSIVDASGQESILQSESLFIATGVRPNSDELGLENTNIKCTESGYIQVDSYLQTTVDGVYALGDVIGKYLFRHSVNFEGEYLLHQHHLGANRVPIQYPPMPHAIFSYPQIAGVGVTEDELMSQGKQCGRDYETAIHHYKNSAMGMAMKPHVGMVKLIAEKGTRKIIGAHILGEKASDIIHMMIVLISAGKTVDFMIDSMIFIHPALSEVIRNAARTLVNKI